MKLFLFTCAAVALATLTPQLKADISLTTGNVSFNFDTDGIGPGFGLTTARGNALENIEAWIQYRNVDSTSAIIEQLDGAQNGLAANEIIFNDIIIFGDDIGEFSTITPVLRFSLNEISPNDAELNYELELNGASFDGGIQVDLNAFVSFDYQGDGILDEALTDNLPLGDVMLVDPTPTTQDVGLFGSKGSADAFDVYDRSTSNPVFDASRFDNIDDFATTGTDLALGHYLSYGVLPSVGNDDFSVSRSGSLGVAIPEPGTAMVLLFGSSALLFRRNRR